ncbi:MAG: SPASM domain-containing protein, partial [Mesorhizobium sp.]
IGQRPAGVLHVGDLEPLRAQREGQIDEFRHLLDVVTMDRCVDGERQAEIVAVARERLTGIMNIDFVTPDYFAVYPKPCMGGWARDAFMVTPDGTVLPCHAAQTIPSLSFERFGPRSLAEIWTDSPAFNAFRGTDWMQQPCRSCERREIDWGGCRCQAMAIARDAAATDPPCAKSPIHA